MGSTSGRVLVWGKTGSHISHPPHIVTSAAVKTQYEQMLAELEEKTWWLKESTRGTLNGGSFTQVTSNNAEILIARELGVNALDVDVKEVDGRVHIQVDDKKFSVSKTQIEKWRSLGIDPYKNIASRIARHIRAR